MTNSLVGFFQYLGGLFKWWVTVMPWEAGLRVRWGKHVCVLGPGIHLRVPLMHTVYKQTVRQRRVDLPVQTISTRDHKTLTLGATLTFAIADILKLYETLSMASATTANMAQSAIAEFVTTHHSDQCTPGQIEQGATEGLDFSQFGLAGARVNVTDFAFVKVYRLIQDSRWTDNSMDTTTPEGMERKQ